MIAMVTLIFGAGLMMISSEPLHADVNIEKKGTSVKIEISNAITKKDADDIAQRVGNFEDADIWLYLKSSGGDVDAAMQIGRIIRKYEAFVQVGGGSKCYSSCVLIYIAGSTRLSYGIIGLHRPYFASAPQSRQEIERQAPIMLQKLKSYVQEMGVADIVYQEMVNTEPAKIKLYKAAEIQRIVPMNDRSRPSATELCRSRMAQSLPRCIGMKNRRMQTTKPWPPVFPAPASNLPLPGPP
jgi:hypothetical protein